MTKAVKIASTWACNYHNNRDIRQATSFSAATGEKHKMFQKLKKLRELRGLSLAKAGAAVGCSAQAFHRYELRQGIPRPSRMAKIVAWSNGHLSEIDFYQTEPPKRAGASRKRRAEARA